MPLSGECLCHDVCSHFCCRDVVEGDQAVAYSFSNKVIANVNVFCSVMKMRVGCKLYSPLVIGKDLLWLAAAGGPGAIGACRGLRAIQWLPLLHSLILMVCPEVW